MTDHKTLIREARDIARLYLELSIAYCGKLYCLPEHHRTTKQYAERDSFYQKAKAFLEKTREA